MSISWATIQNNYGVSCIPYFCPKEWNRLPLSLRSSNSLPSFKKQLKTHNFFLVSRNWKVNWIFIWWLTIRNSDSRFGCDLERVINFICIVLYWFGSSCDFIKQVGQCAGSQTGAQAHACREAGSQAFKHACHETGTHHLCMQGTRQTLKLACKQAGNTLFSICDFGSKML